MIQTTKKTFFYLKSKTIFMDFSQRPNLKQFLVFAIQNNAFKKDCFNIITK